MSLLATSLLLETGSTATIATTGHAVSLLCITAELLVCQVVHSGPGAHKDKFEQASRCKACPICRAPHLLDTPIHKRVIAHGTGQRSPGRLEAHQLPEATCLLGTKHSTHAGHHHHSQDYHHTRTHALAVLAGAT